MSKQLKATPTKHVFEIINKKANTFTVVMDRLFFGTFKTYEEAIEEARLQRVLRDKDGASLERLKEIHKDIGDRIAELEGFKKTLSGVENH